MAPGPTGTTIEEEAGAVSMLIACEKLQKPTHGGDADGDVIIITIIDGASSGDDEVTTKIINKSK